MCLGFQDVINSTGNSTLTINYSFEIYYTSPNGISCYYHLDIAFVPALWVDFRFHQPKKKRRKEWYMLSILPCIKARTK